MMAIVRIIIMCISMTALPLLVGTLFLSFEREGSKLLFCWVAGQMLLWAGFQGICVPMILKGLSFDALLKCFFGLEALLAAAAGICLIRRAIRREKAAKSKADKPREEKTVYLFWGIFAVLLLIQIFCLFFLSYEEGDDAYYVAITTINVGADTMYTKLPYTGGSNILDARHALAPFPIWVSVLAWISGLSGAATAHIAVPPIFVPMTYALYYLLGEKLIAKNCPGRKWKIPMYLSFVALLIMFGGYSTFSAENFLLVRSAQGKSVLANLIIPFMLYLFLTMMERLENGEKTGLSLWILLASALIAGCLCSTLGTLLLCIFAGVAALCASLVYRRWSVLFGTAFCMLPPVIFAGLYLIM